VTSLSPSGKGHAAGPTGVPATRALLRRLAAKYVWWKTADDALRQPRRIAAQVMNLGDYADVQQLAEQVGDDYLREVVRTAEAGEFDARSWTYWHYRLGLAALGEVPRIPVRRLE